MSTPHETLQHLRAEVDKEFRSQGSPSADRVKALLEEGRRLGVPEEILAATVRKADQERILRWLLQVTESRVVHGTLGYAVKEQLLRLACQAGLGQEQGAQAISDFLNLRALAPTPSPSPPCRRFRSQLVSRLKSLGADPTSVRIIERLGQTSGLPDHEWKAIVADEMAARELADMRPPPPFALDAAPSPPPTAQDRPAPSAPVPADNRPGSPGPTPPTSPPAPVATSPAEQPAAPTDDHAAGRPHPGPSLPPVEPPKPRPASRFASRISRRNDPRPTWPLLRRVIDGLIVALALFIAFRAFTSWHDRRLPTLRPEHPKASEYPPARPRPANDSRRMPAPTDPETSSEGEDDDAGTGDDDGEEDTAGETPSGLETKAGASPNGSGAPPADRSPGSDAAQTVADPSQAGALVRRAVETRPSSGRPTVTVPLDLRILSVARVLALAVWLQSDEDAKLWTPVLANLLAGKEPDRDSLVSRVPCMAEAAASDDPLLQAFHVVHCAGTAAAALTVRLSPSADPPTHPDSTGPPSPTSHPDRILCQTATQCLAAYRTSVSRHPNYAKLPASEVRRIEVADEVMERYLADTWLQKLCNRQYRSVDWLRLLVKLNSPEAEPDAIRIIQQMEVEDAMAASPIEQFRSGLLAEVRLLGLLIPDKPAAQVPVQATGDGP